MGNAIKDRDLVISYLMDNFNYSYEMAITWIGSSNPNFGYTSPEDLIQAGRVDKVMAFMIAVKDGY
jgi:hypothetical protein